MSESAEKIVILADSTKENLNIETTTKEKYPRVGINFLYPVFCRKIFRSILVKD